MVRGDQGQGEQGPGQILRENDHIIMYHSSSSSSYHYYFDQAMKIPGDDPEIYRSKAEELSKKFGDKFEQGYKTKLQEILYGE